MGAPVGLLMLLFAQAPVGPEHRFALFVGQYEGGQDTRRLRYAADDARRMHDVFLRVGGVRADDALLLTDATADDVTTALGELERRVRDAKARGERSTLLFYYAGHAQDGAFRLGNTKLPLEAVKARLATGPADHRVAILDTCRSSPTPRAAGMRRPPAFEVETDATRQVQGLVIVTASAEDEETKESDLIGGSTFSYFFSTGLMGSADLTGDGRVSLSEALAWSMERTLAAEAPAPAVDLLGTGELVLTDLTSHPAGLRVPASAPAGNYLVIDGRGVIVAETTVRDQARLLAIPPGKYTLKRRLPDRLRLGVVEVPPGELVTIDETTFQNAKLADDPVRGTGVRSTFSRHWSLAAAGQYQLLFDRPTNAGGVFPSAPLLGAEATLHNVVGRGFGLSIDGAYGWASGTVTGALLSEQPYNYTLLSFGASALYEWFQDDRWVPYVGVHLSFNLMSREFTDAALAKQSYSTFTPGALVGLKVRLTRNVSIAARARLHYLPYDVDGLRSLGSADFGALLDYEFKD